VLPAVADRSASPRPAVPAGPVPAGSVKALRPVTPLAIVVALLDRLTRQAEDLFPAQALLPDLRRARDLAAGLDPYLARCTTPESPALRRLADRTRGENWRQRPDVGGVHLEPEMLCGHVEGKFLQMLVGLTRAVDVLEVGLFTGYSALAMAEALPVEGHLVACEIDPTAATLARRWLDWSPSGGKVDIRVGPALGTLQQLADQGRSFDFVFLDADKTGYAGYLQLLLGSTLLAPHGLLCVDNTLMQGETYLPRGTSTPQGRALAAFNATVADNPRVEQVMLPLRDGLTLIRRAER